MEKQQIGIQSFIKNFERQFSETVSGQIKPESRFRDLPEWSSLQAVIVVSGFEEDYGVTLSSDELQDATTIKDLYSIVIRKIDA